MLLNLREKDKNQFFCYVKVHLTLFRLQGFCFLAMRKCFSRLRNERTIFLPSRIWTRRTVIFTFFRTLFRTDVRTSFRHRADHNPT